MYLFNHGPVGFQRELSLKGQRQFLKQVSHYFPFVSLPLYTYKCRKKEKILATLMEDSASQTYLAKNLLPQDPIETDQLTV